ncbi:cytochrome P450 [Aquihabitans sp. McL0605]|uniref:cytochrome P450 n=1 Tax=Aquihabitans sp. McL0605 TaxID=3415671 RepID=UPI003CE80F04
MATAELDDLQLDLTRPGFYLRPDYFEILAALRAAGPAHRTVDGSWAVTRYDDIRAISRDPARFVSSRGVLINDPMRNDGSAVPNTFSILHLDPPVHATYRRVVNRQFTPRAAARLEGTVRAAVDEALDRVDPTVELDAVDELASTVPIAVIAELFGVGDADRDLFRRWSDAVIATPDAAGDPLAAGADELGQMADVLLAHIDSPAGDGNDLLAILKNADLDGRPLNRFEIMGFCMTLLVAGNETTRTLISGGMEALHDHPDQRAALADDADLLPGAVEEMLRWVTPIQAFGRTAVVDVDLGGTTVGAGEFVVLLYASGNRDEAAFGPTADRFDIRRDSTPTHVAFGFGEHLCLGAALARLEARLFFEGLLARFPDYELTGPVERTRSTLINGAARMPVRLRP